MVRTPDELRTAQEQMVVWSIPRFTRGTKIAATAAARDARL